ncbi:Uncharacterized conserved protein YbjT, contains NAD(P)-binding and DUF2867 domains [Nakamurella panacisegetis]|uniref:Uncharacterized conserved protein YbjT, contains NAD(P)-binding and DUF2867 domains n=1 Tax=Nakamurella panacisegetis TaxID=1090615 RepID=A0A1H0KF21_9ACTN|nr:NAD(P)H-binding protein [Nakamurella panacisegetis]SDO54544.1 Uncharacterized conserved protein YbjT, contains NAD(P)-binding and DUF2867 domains [Nakamurella panacisegetis]
MSSVLVTGGTGNLGRHVVRQLLDRGHQVRLASRSAAPVEAITDYSWARVDYRSRAGLDAALIGVDTIVHCAGGSARGEAETMAALLSSGRRARVKHLVYISIVGVDRLPLGYYRAKYAAERSLIGSGLPWTILRTTQFHDLALAIVKGVCRSPVALAPRGVSLQPVAVEEVALRLSELAGADPAGRVPELGGPEIRTLADLARLYLRSTGRRRPIVPLPVPGRLIKGLRAGHGLTPDHADGVQTFAEYLAAGGATA